MSHLSLKHVCKVNTRTLSDRADQDQEIRYCDVTSVERGQLTVPSETVRFGDAPSRARRLTKTGDSVISTVRPYLKAVAQVPESDDLLVFSTAFAVLEPDLQRIDPRFLYWALQSDSFTFEATRRSVGVSYPAITAEDLIRIKIDLPDLSRQARIVRFLDEHTAKIDQLVEKQHQLIALAESRLRIKAERLAWGLGRSDCGTKSPIVEPPSGWVSIKNKALLKHVDVRSVTGEEELLSVSHITGVTPRTMKNVNMFEAESNVGYKLVEPGQLAINTMWAWMGALGVSEYSGIVSPSYDVYQFRDSDQVEGKYFDLAYRTQTYVDLMRANSRGIWSSRLRLYPEVFLSLPMVVPPLLEQKRIAAHYEEARADAEKLVTTTQRAIDLALERRAALVTAAVTGQIEV